MTMRYCYTHGVPDCQQCGLADMSNGDVIREVAKTAPQHTLERLRAIAEKLDDLDFFKGTFMEKRNG